MVFSTRSRVSPPIIRAMSDGSLNFVFFLTPEHTIRSLFNDDDVIVLFELPFTLADCTTMMGVFPSKTQARKNGWGGEIERGFRKYKIGKKRFCTFWPLLWEDRYTQSTYYPWDES